MMLLLVAASEHASCHGVPYT